ncbi:alkaline phytoceramidase [Amniculicola lignicola CBS 123094]|uniref:Alkaline phytoceramidase n=1 Tax=Amniculicola lignicola CBS 123094 TaxID=1392246 RepID=A0A6A5WVX5_9PLEO|nr:alkaline phytoceramidase [Amniculicola lignicola CBS 123094]
MAAQLLSWFPSIQYPPEQEGRWSPVTSTINWCEEDYYATIYSAEIVNTFTNVLFMYLAAKGIHNCLTHGHDNVFVVAFVGYLLVGCGSFLFHATLKYPMQLIDELNMIYTTCLMCYVTFSYGHSKAYSTALAGSLVSIAIGVTLYYHYLQDPTFHQTVYAILTIIVFFRQLWVMEVNIRPRFQSQARKRANPRLQGGLQLAQEREDARDLKILRQMWTMVPTGLGIFLGGFLLWHLDREYCSDFRRWRRQIGLPWGMVLEAHGWWHLMTGTGAYFYIIWGMWLRQCLNFKQDEYRLDWPNFASMPVIVRERKADTNGSAKKGN